MHAEDAHALFILVTTSQDIFPTRLSLLSSVPVSTDSISFSPKEIFHHFSVRNPCRVLLPFSYLSTCKNDKKQDFRSEVAPLALLDEFWERTKEFDLIGLHFDKFSDCSRIFFLSSRVDKRVVPLHQNPGKEAKEYKGKHKRRITSGSGLEE